MPSPEELHRDAVGAAARSLLVQLAGSPPPAGPVVERLLSADLVVTVAVVPRRTRGAVRLTPCERDVIAVLQRATRRLTEPEVAGELARYGLRYASVTIRRALAHLVHLGYCDSCKRAPRGYLLLSLPPLSNPA